MDSLAENAPVQRFRTVTPNVLYYPTQREDAILLFLGDPNIPKYCSPGKCIDLLMMMQDHHGIIIIPIIKRTL